MSRQLPSLLFTAFDQHKSIFYYAGIGCAATLYLPQGAQQPRPAILMVGGWGSVQQALTQPFVSRFLAAGYAVMEFDFPGWGRSAGWPRQDINPWQRVRCASAALAHLKAQKAVDADRIAVWGTSFGGGHAIDLAALHPDLYAVIAQVPMLDGRATSLRTPRPRLLRFAQEVLWGLIKPGYAHQIPTLAAEGELGTMDRDGSYQALELSLAANPGKRYVNKVTTRSLLTMAFYRPITRLAEVEIPLLIVGALEDSVAPFVREAVHRLAPAQSEIVELKANHFDPYFEPHFSPNIEAQLAFLAKVMPV